MWWRKGGSVWMLKLVMEWRCFFGRAKPSHRKQPLKRCSRDQLSKSILTTVLLIISNPNKAILTQKSRKQGPSFQGREFEARFINSIWCQTNTSKHKTPSWEEFRRIQRILFKDGIVIGYHNNYSSIEGHFTKKTAFFQDQTTSLRFAANFKLKIFRKNIFFSNFENLKRKSEENETLKWISTENFDQILNSLLFLFEVMRDQKLFWNLDFLTFDASCEKSRLRSFYCKITKCKNNCYSSIHDWYSFVKTLFYRSSTNISITPFVFLKNLSLLVLS